jgi:superfamily II DNA or RNA helicase
MQDWQFGELWVGREKPSAFEHVFASIQTLANADLDRIPRDHFDVVIVDEFHHAAAPTYKKLLDYLNPREALGTNCNTREGRRPVSVGYV